MDQAAATTTPWRMRFSQMDTEPLPTSAYARWQQRPTGPWQIGLSQLPEVPELGGHATEEVTEPWEAGGVAAEEEPVEALAFPPQAGRQLGVGGRAPSVQPFFIRGGCGSIPPPHPAPSTALRVQPAYIRGGFPDCSDEMLNAQQMQRQQGAPEAAAPMAWAIHGDSCSQAQHAPAAGPLTCTAKTWALHGSVPASEEDVLPCGTSGRAAGPNLGQQPLAWSLRDNCHPPAVDPKGGMASDTVIGTGRTLANSHVMDDDDIDSLGDAMDVDGPPLLRPLWPPPSPPPRSQQEQSLRWPLPQAYAQLHPDVSAPSLPLAAAMLLSGPEGLPHPLSTVTASGLPAAVATHVIAHPPWATWSIAEQTLAAAAVALPAWSAGDIPLVPVCEGQARQEQERVALPSWSAGDIPPVPVWGERAQVSQEQVLPPFEGGVSVQALVDQLAAAQREAQRGQWHPPQSTSNAAASPLLVALQPRCLYSDLDLDTLAQDSDDPRSASASGAPTGRGLSVEELIKRLGMQQQEQQWEQQREQQQQQRQREQQEGQEGQRQLVEQVQQQHLDDHRQPAETSQQVPGWGLQLGSHLPANRVGQEQPSQQASCLGLMGSQHRPPLRPSANVGEHRPFTLPAAVVGIVDTASRSAPSPPHNCAARQPSAPTPGARNYAVPEELPQQECPAAGLDQGAAVGDLDLDPDLGAAACWDLLSSSSSLMMQASPGPSFALLPEAAALTTDHALSGRSKLRTDTVIH